MLKMYKGCHVPDAEKLHNEYEVMGDNMLNANVDADKISAVIMDFVGLHANEPVFFFLELPSEQRSVQQISTGQNIVGDDNETYYLDNITPAKVAEILERAGDILINDGVSRFGFGGNFSNNHIIIDKYNVVSIFAMDMEPLADIFLRHGLTRVDNLVTAWDTFSEEDPGIASRYEKDDMDVFSLPTLFAPDGMYLLNIRPDE